MHSLKNITPKKNDHKLPMETKKSTPTKNPDGRDNIIGASQKHALPHSTNWTKSVFKSDFIDAKSALLQQRQPSKNLTKRKVEKFTNETEKKKIKPAAELENAKTTTPKKDSKRKGVQSKTVASYVCKYCCRRFRKIELLREHTLTHGSKPSYVCYLCGTEAGAFSSLMAHFVKHSAPKKVLKTDKIQNDKAPHDLSDFSLSTKSTIRCSHCKISFPSTEKLALHYCSIAGKKSEYNCAYCGQVSTSIDDYRLHVLSHSVTPFLCMHCNFKGPTKKLLDRHLDICKKRPKMLNEKVLLKCKICAKEYNNKKDLNQHSKVCKPIPDSRVTLKNCQCNSVFSNKDDFINHKLTCSALETKVQDKSQCSKELTKQSSQKESFLCSHCGELFYDQTDHENHQVVCFEDEYSFNEKTSVLCQTCGSMFEATAIEEHQKQCLQSSEMSNQEAEKEIATESDFDSPSKRRSARLVCRQSSLSEESPKSTPRKRKLNFQDGKERRKVKMSKNKSIIKGRRGRQSKVGNADFKCNFCDLTFCSKSTLLRHKRMHSGNPYFSCKYCGKFFFRKDVYTRHEVNVHNKSTGNAFCCYYCKLYFKDPITLKDHVLLTHKENAFLPVKTELTGDGQQDGILSPSDIKKEGNPNEIKTFENFIFKNNTSKNDTLPSTVPLKKCGICLVSFKNVFEIENHMREFHRSKENSPSISQIDDSQTKQVGNRSVRNNKEITEIIEIEQTGSINGLLRLSNSNKANSTSIPALTSVKDSISNMQNKNDKPSHISNSDTQWDLQNQISETEPSNYLCKLCLAKFSSESLLTAHESAEHKMVDWYQCLVCDTSGPKQDMIEHMFSHMYKVGTIVVSSTSNNLDSLLPFRKKPVNSENTDICTVVQTETTLDAATMDNADEIFDCDLPPLIDYGSSSSSLLKDNSLLVEILSQDRVCPIINQDQIDCNHEDKAKQNSEQSIITVPQKPSENENASQSVQEKLTVNESLSSETNNLECLVSSKSLLIPPNKTIPNDVPASSLTGDNIEQLKELCKIENTEQSKEMCKVDNTEQSKETSKIDNTEQSKETSKIDNTEQSKETSKIDNTEQSKETCMIDNTEQSKETCKIDNTELSKETCKIDNTEQSKEMCKIDNTYLSSPKPILPLSPKPLLVADEVGSSVDNTNKSSEVDDGAENDSNFSQLRYLLENFKKKDPLDDVECVSEKAEEPNYQLHIVEDECEDEYAKKDSLSWLNSMESETKKDIEMAVIKEIEVKQKHSATALLLKNVEPPISFDKQTSKSVPQFPKASSNSCKTPVLQPEQNQNLNTCLKFDINQSRSIFAEHDLFQASQIPNKILDFSDLIGDSINVNDNIFQCDQVQSVSSSSYSLPTNKFTYTSSNKSHFFPESMKCNNCNVKFNDANEMSLHICSKSVTNFTNCINSAYNFEPKNMFQTPASRINSPGIADYENAASSTEKYPILDSITDIFGASNSSSVCNKVQSLQYESEQLNNALSKNMYSANNSSSVCNKVQIPQYESEQINNALSKNMCNKCYRTFRDAKECAKHSLSCSKLTWCKNETSETLKFPETLHSLLAKREVKTQQQSCSAMIENDNASYDTVLNLSKNPFSS